MNRIASGLVATFCAAALGSAGGCTIAPAEPSTRATPAAAPKTALWVGNSFFYYNNSMHGHVRELLRQPI